MVEIAVAGSCRSEGLIPLARGVAMDVDDEDADLDCRISMEEEERLDIECRGLLGDFDEHAYWHHDTDHAEYAADACADNISVEEGATDDVGHGLHFVLNVFVCQLEKAIFVECFCCCLCRLCALWWPLFRGSESGPESATGPASTNCWWTPAR